MKKIIRIFIFYFYFQSSLAFAITGMCPFKATDSNVVGLATETSSALQGLVDKRNECNDAVVAAVNSAKSLPDVISQIQDPASQLVAEEEWINEEIAKTMTDPSYGSWIDPLTGKSYIDTLLERKNKIPGEISKARIFKNYEKKELAKGQALSMTQNLISNLTLAMANRDSKCAKAISGGLGSRVLMMGLGLISSAAPLTAASNVGAISASATLLSDFVNMFSKMTPKSLQTFDEMNQTNDLACLYYQVTTTHCAMVEQSGSDTRNQNAKTALEKEALKLQNYELYNNLANLKELQPEIQEATSAIARNSPAQDKDSSSTSLPRDVTDAFKPSDSSPTEADQVRTYFRQFEQLSKYFGPNPTVSIDNLSTGATQFLSYALQSFMSYIHSRSESISGYKNDTNSGGMGNPSRTDWRSLFMNNNAAIAKYLSKRMKELNVSDSQSGSIANIDDANRLHAMVKKSEFREKIIYAQKAYSAINKYAQENSSQPDLAADMNSLIKQTDQSLKTLELLQEWSQLDPQSQQTDPNQSYEKRMSEINSQLKGILKPKSDDTFSINEKISILFTDPIKKAESIFTSKKGSAVKSPFARPFDYSKAGLSDYERFLSLMGAYNVLVDTSIRPADQKLISDTRSLFEEDDSFLRKSFLNGLEKMIDRIPQSPDPQTSQKIASQMCALSYTIPTSDTHHAISSCEKIMPHGMKPYLHKGNRKTPDCTFYEYYKKGQREGFFKDGKIPDLPNEKEGTQ